MTLGSEPTVQQLFDLTGKVALITGASGHLGSAMGRALAEAGATVVAASRDIDRARAAAASLPRPGGARHVGVALDQMEAPSIDEGFAGAVRLAGKVDILVNNGLHRESAVHDWTNVTFEEFSTHVANNAGYYFLARRLRDHAVERNAPASIVMIGSMYGVVGSYPDAYEGVSVASPVQYHALKGGTIHMCRHLAVYWARDNVRVNCLSPGPFPIPGGIPAEMDRRLCGKCPMHRMGEPWELKGAIVFLAGDASSYLTGQNILVDGGWTAW
jgi:gluconate 5-dehydrogenase